MEILLARQGIYNQKEEVVAYELLYRNSYRNSYDEKIEASEATVQVIKTVFKFGAERLTNGKKAFVNFPEECIVKEKLSGLNKDKIVIEILESVNPNNEVLSKIKKLRDKGYIIALDDVTINTMHGSFKDLVDIYKVDFKDTTIEERKKLILKIKSINKNAKFLAEKIESKEEFTEALENNYTYFQGYYFSKPQILKEKFKI